jgi:hypothetical protein
MQHVQRHWLAFQPRTFVPIRDMAAIEIAHRQIAPAHGV